MDACTIGGDDHIEGFTVVGVNTDFGSRFHDTFCDHRVHDIIEVKVDEGGRCEPSDDETIGNGKVVSDVSVDIII